jgi:hypothetical protein
MKPIVDKNGRKLVRMTADDGTTRYVPEAAVPVPAPPELREAMRRLNLSEREARLFDSWALPAANDVNRQRTKVGGAK